MRALALVLLLLLAGCWSGARFYRAAEAVAPIAPGDYRLVPMEGVMSGTISVAVLPDGLTEATFHDRSQEPMRAGFVPLDRRRRWYLGWSEPRSDLPGAPPLPTLYSLLEREPAGAWRLHQPMCEGTERIAAAAGARVERGELGVDCSFPDRASLERAARRLASRISTHFVMSTKLEPVQPQ